MQIWKNGGAENETAREDGLRPREGRIEAEREDVMGREDVGRPAMAAGEGERVRVSWLLPFHISFLKFQ